MKVKDCKSGGRFFLEELRDTPEKHKFSQHQEGDAEKNGIKSGGVDHLQIDLHSDKQVFKYSSSGQAVGAKNIEKDHVVEEAAGKRNFVPLH